MVNNRPLAGARIWLSGAVPEADRVSEDQRAAILDFVRKFAAQVFQRGGHILHGSHPSFTPTLLEEAERYQKAGGRKDCLTLSVSRHWSKHPEKVDTENWRRFAIVYETPEAAGDNIRDDSLKLLRKWMVSRCDTIVVVGGKWWQANAARAGIPLEVGLAVEYGLPCFLLGGLGGVANDFFVRNPTIFSQLKNGLDTVENQKFANATDVESLVKKVCDQLERLPLVRGQGDDGVSFRILSLDGGGLKGAFTAAALASWELHTGLRVVDHFDLIAGTRTGGIQLLVWGLALPGKKCWISTKNVGL